MKEYSPKIRPTASTINCLSKERVGYCIQTPPILNNNKSQIIFISSNNCIRKTKYKVYDINKDEFIQDEEVKCNNNMHDAFDIINTVYTLDPNTNKIYLIKDNKDLKILDLNKNKLISTNKSIETTENNFAQIECIDDHIYILGAEKIENNDEESRKTNLINIPYSICKRNNGDDNDEESDINELISISLSLLKRNHGETGPLIKNFGKSSRTMIMGSNQKIQLICYGFIRTSTVELSQTVIPEDIYNLCYEFYPKEHQYVFIMGGLRAIKSRWSRDYSNEFVSSEHIYVCDINNLIDS